MKKLLPLLFIFPTLLNAQLAKSFEGNSLDVYKPIADLIVRYSNGSYALQGIDTIGNAPGAAEYSIKYKSATDVLEIIVQYSKAGKPATDLYAITAIKAPFQLLFPFWKQHFEPEADEKVTKAHEQGVAYGLKKPNGHEKVFSFGKQENNPAWRIRIKDY